MLILAIDTSGRQGSIALALGAPESFQVLEVVPLAGRSYSARLIPELSALLARHHRRIQDLEGFAAVSGPGSFTGLRVGLSTAKGLAEILRRPLAAVSMLEAVAAETTHEGRVVAALDAGRKEIYAGEYDVYAGVPRLIRESLLSRAEFFALLEANEDAELITPDQELRQLAPLHRHIYPIVWPDAGAIARLGLRKIQAGETISPEEFDANYIRRSDAEIFSKP